MGELLVVGKGVPRVDARVKATGEAKYAVDIVLPGMLHGKFLRSPYAHARILNIDTSKAEKLPGVKKVITAKDLPEGNTGPFVFDKPPLSRDEARYVGDEIAAVAAETAAIAKAALDLIEVEYEELPAVFDPEDAMKPDAPIIHENFSEYIKVRGEPKVEKGIRNVAATVHQGSGDVEKAFAEADYIFEDQFTTPYVAHTCMEPHACVASFDASGKVTVWSSTQSVTFFRFGLAEIFKMPMNKVRVIQAFTGGGFGAKVDPLPLDFCCVALSKMTGRPVKIAYTREEEFTAARGRFPYILDMKTGVKKDGTITARKVRVICDCGAYADMGPGTVQWGGHLHGSLYRIKNYCYDAVSVYTNKAYGTAFRGYGNNQNHFAGESQMDMIAERLEMNPVELRLKNATQTGDVTASGAVILSCGLSECIKKVSTETAKWREEIKRKGVKDAGVKRKGIGLACFAHASSSRFLPNCDADFSAAYIRLNEDGTVHLAVGSNDIGQGSSTVMVQIAAEELGVRPEDVEIISADTEAAPLSLGSWASRETVMGGNAVIGAAKDAKRQLFEVAAKALEANVEDLEARDRRIYVKGSPDKGMSIAEVVLASIYTKGGQAIIGKAHFDADDEIPDRETGVGNMAQNYPFGAQAVEVEIDIETGKVEVLRVAAAHDLGRAINSILSEGQIEGGVIQAIGYALTEEIVFDNQGKISNPNFGDYRILTALDTAMPVKSFFVEPIDPKGPFGAKGLGECTMIPTPPAIANAIYDAIGVRIKELPITPEKILNALK